MTAGNSRWVGHGRVMSLVTMAMDCPGFTMSHNRGVPIGVASANRIGSTARCTDSNQRDALSRNLNL